MSTYNAVDICNMALDLLGAERITTISAPQKANERHFALQYGQRRDAELRKNRWNFSKRWVQLVRTGDNPLDPDRYSYDLPGNALYVPPHKTDEIWKPRGNRLVSETDASITVMIIERVSESEFDPLFVDVLAASLAYHGCEKLTQSNEKKTNTYEIYKTAMRVARQANAFENGTEDIQDDDGAFSWVRARMI